MYLEDIGIDVSVSRWLNGRSHDLVKDVRRFVRALEKKISRELREEIFDEVQIEEPLKLRISEQSKENFAVMIEGRPYYLRGTYHWNPCQARLEEKKVILQVSGRSRKIPHNDFAHEIGHGIYRLMDSTYQAKFGRVFHELSDQVRVRIQDGEDPIKVTRDVHTPETFLAPFEELPTHLCWKGFVGKVDQPWEWELAKYFHKDTSIPELTKAYSFHIDSEEAFCEFFAFYHKFNRGNHTLFPHPRHKNPYLKAFGDDYLEKIIESARR